MAGPLTVECPLCHEHLELPVVSTLVVNTETNHVDLRVDRSAAYGHLAKCAEKAGDQVGQTLNRALGSVTEPAKAAPAVRRGTPIPTTPRRELAGRIDQVLAILERDGRLTHGNRACTMCGTTQDECMRSMNVRQSQGFMRAPKRVKGTPCCPACGEGNTHPTGREGVTCAEWGREHGAQN